MINLKRNILSHNPGMKALLVTILFLTPLFAFSQNKADSLKNAANLAQNDSVLSNVYLNLYMVYEEANRDSAWYYAEQNKKLGIKNNKKLLQARSLTSQSYLLLNRNRYAESLSGLLKAFTLIEKAGDEKNSWIENPTGSAAYPRAITRAYAHHTFANLMTPTLNKEQQVFHYREAMRLAKEVGIPQRELLANLGLGRTYFDLNRLDSALFFELEAERVSYESGLDRWLSPIYSYIGGIYLAKNEPALALQYLYKGVETGFQTGNRAGTAQNYFRLAQFYLARKQKDSALFYAHHFNALMQTVSAVALSMVDKGTSLQYLADAYLLNGQRDSAFKYYQLSQLAKDSIYKARMNSLAEFQSLSLREQLRLRDVEKEQALYQSRVRTYGLIAALVVFSLIALILYRNNRQKQKANQQLESALAELRSTQVQLIQSEKMASLGELTAGIAHEIQNPLNFVNNFSEVSHELVLEMKEALADGDPQTASVILGDLTANLEKINHHGKRADGIIKGMLQHSRAASGAREPTNLNALCDEFLRLAYHGLKARDENFNATLGTSFDESLPKVHLISQEIGRVILNLVNNAFYSVNERMKTEGMIPGSTYTPQVTLSTRNLGNKAEICVTDNGNGIPDAIRGKIFQPFFTTKPTGQGTGLGLSLSYDIVTKGHGGTLHAEPVPGGGEKFIVTLPL